MAKLKAKTEEQKDYIEDVILKSICMWKPDWHGTPIEGVHIDDYITFDQMAEIVDYLRGDEYLIKVDEPDLLSKIEYVEVKRKVEDYSRLLDENRKLFNICERLKKENEMLKEKTKRLPRIATLNKRIHELKEKLKKYEEE